MTGIRSNGSLGELVQISFLFPLLFFAVRHCPTGTLLKLSHHIESERSLVIVPSLSGLKERKQTKAKQGHIFYVHLWPLKGPFAGSIFRPNQKRINSKLTITEHEPLCSLEWYNALEYISDVSSHKLEVICNPFIRIQCQ